MSPRLSALAAIVLWGISFVATKAALREISPVTLIFTRFGLGAALLLFILTLRGEALFPRAAASAPSCSSGSSASSSTRCSRPTVSP